MSREGIKAEKRAYNGPDTDLERIGFFEGNRYWKFLSGSVGY